VIGRFFAGVEPDALRQRFAVDMFTTMANSQSGFSIAKSDQPAQGTFVDETFIRLSLTMLRALPHISNVRQRTEAP
jgi:hypothetical protein